MLEPGRLVLDLSVDGDEMKAWLITCESGRTFVVYATSAHGAARYFKTMMPDECVVHPIESHDLYPTVADAIVDNRKAPGA